MEMEKLNYYYESKISAEECNINIYKFNGNKEEIWKKFKNHHYLSAEMNKACNCYTIYWNDTLVGFVGVLPNPSGWVKYSVRPSRVVILPDYQGLGIGSKVIEFLGDYYLNKGYKFYFRTTHLRLRRFFEKSELWEASSHNNKKSDKDKNFHRDENVQNRICGAYEYMGKNYIKPHIDIHCTYTEDFDLEIFEKDLLYLSENYFVTVITNNILDKSPIEDICLKNGIRTQLLYIKKSDGKETLVNKYKDKK